MIPKIIFALCVVALLLATLYYRSTRESLRQRLGKYVRQREAVLKFFNRLGERVTRNIDLDETLEFITDFAMSSTGAESGAIYLLNPDTNTFSPRAIVGYFPPLKSLPELTPDATLPLKERLEKEEVKPGEGIVGEVALRGESALVTDGNTDPRIPIAVRKAMKINSLLFVPLQLRDRVIGVLAVANKSTGRAFTETDRQLMESISTQAATTLNIVRLNQEIAEKVSLEREIAIAQDFQQMLLPDKNPDIKELDIAAYTQPAREVGGDYYDFIQIDDAHLGIVIADVCGKGIPGALVMAITRCSLLAEARDSLSPRNVLSRLNKRLIESTRDNIFVTMTYGVIDLKKRTICFARAGHEPLVIFRKDMKQPQVISPSGMVLGMVADENFDVLEEYEMSLLDDEVLLFYTDGAIEATDADGQEFGFQRMLNAVEPHLGDSANNIVHSILGGIEDFNSHAQQHDDITLLVIKAHFSATDSLDLEAHKHTSTE